MIFRYEDGKQLTQWLRVAIFGELAQEFSERAAKGDRCYVEGQLTLNTWSDKSSGATKSGLSLAAWKCEKLPAIGRNRQFREKGHAVAADSFRQPGSQAERQLRATDFTLNDPLPF